MSIWDSIKKFFKIILEYLNSIASRSSFNFLSVILGTFILNVTFMFSRIFVGQIIVFVQNNIEDIYILSLITLAIDLIIRTTTTYNNNLFKLITNNFVRLMIFLGLRSEKSDSAPEETEGDDDKKVNKVTFDNIGGLYEAKKEMQELVKFLTNKDRFIHLGAKCPKGILLTGEPGTGKTLLVKALANETKYNLLYGAADAFSSPFIAEGGRKVRKFFAKARSLAPCIVFLDEIDSLTRKRNSAFSTSNESDNVFNVLLTEMDGFTSRGEVIVIGATNQVDIMDPAVLRPGRFDRVIHIDLPAYQERLEIAQIILNEYTVDQTVSPNKISAMTVGMSGAYIRQLINGAAIAAGIADKNAITFDDITESYYTMEGGGSAREFLKLSHEDREKTAYHEAGHTMLSVLTDHPKPLVVTILPRGKSLGCTIFEGSDKDIVSLTYNEAQCHLQVLFGGYVAEEIFYGVNNVTSGASGDLISASSMADRMVKRYGWVQEYGFFVMDEAAPFHYAETSKSEADRQVQLLLKNAYNVAKEIISSNMDIMRSLVAQLLVKDTLTKEEILSICIPVDQISDITNESDIVESSHEDSEDLIITNECDIVESSHEDSEDLIMNNE